MASTDKRMRGLLLRNGVWHIDKCLYGERVCESTRTSKLTEARKRLEYRVGQVRSRHLYGYTFGDLAIRYLADHQHKRSLERDRRAIETLNPYIGTLPVRRVHQETLGPFIQSRLNNQISPSTVNRELAVVRMILNLASRVWRDDGGHPLLSVAPYIPILRDPFARDPYPLGVDEQKLLFSELDDHLLPMALFKVNTGLREQEVTGLRWDWEVKIPELRASIFVIPGAHVKARRSRYVFLNRIARSVIASCRGKHSEFVFSRQGKPVGKIYNSGWKAARKRASERYAKELGRSCPAGFQAIRVHDLKHTFGHRLRGAGVNFEDRVVLLGHRSTLHPTTHYSAAEVRSLINATEAVCRLQAKASAAIAVVRFETDHDHRLRAKDRSAGALPGRLASNTERGARLRGYRGASQRHFVKVGPLYVKRA
jgi:integrase